MALRRLWVENTTVDFDAVDPDRTVAVLPVGAVEQHGPHLPVAVDACIGQAVVDHMLGLLAADAPVVVLPMLPIGKSNEHLAYRGTLTLSAETLIRLWTEVAESVHRAGIRKLVIVNSHGGQPQIMDIVARDLRVRLAMFVVVLNYWAVADMSDLFDAAERRHGIHGGAGETSTMLYLRPDLVRDGERRDFVPVSVAMEQQYRFLRPEGGGVGFGWQTQDLHPSGACGDATDADAGRGEQVVRRAAAGLAALLDEVAAYGLDALTPMVSPTGPVAKVMRSG